MPAGLVPFVLQEYSETAVAQSKTSSDFLINKGKARMDGNNTLNRGGGGCVLFNYCFALHFKKNCHMSGLIPASLEVDM